jgi:GNAT superfamily N-acetyltransferase
VTGEIDLPTLLESLQPTLSDERFGFASLPHGAAVPPGVRPVGTFAEAEGLTVIAPAQSLAAANVEHQADWALVTLRVHSSLQAVGMMAAISQALARQGISVNPVSAYHHDHLFVPWDRRHDCIAALGRLSRRGEHPSAAPAGESIPAVRRASIEDVEALVPLFDAYRVFYEQESDETLARCFLGERLAKGDSTIFIAERGTELAGFTQLYPSFSSTRARRIFVLNDLYVTPQARGTGAARALLNAAAAFAHSEGALRLTLSTAHTNAAAQKLYERSGWVRDEHFRTYNLAL